MSAPANSSGRFDLDAHDGLKKRGLGLLHAFSEGDTAGHFERQLIGVDIVIAAVVERDAEVDDGIAGKVSARCRLLNSLLDGGNEVARDGSAEDIVDELKAGAALERLDANLAVAELAVASGLFFVAAMRVGASPDGFAIRNLWRLERDLGMVAAAKFGDDGFDVRLACAGDQELVGLRVAEEAKEKIFLHQLMNGGRELVFVGAGLRLDCVGHRRFRQGDRVEEDFVALVAESVARERVPELGDGAEVARMQFVDGHGSVALHDGEMGESFHSCAAHSLSPWRRSLRLRKRP